MPQHPSVYAKLLGEKIKKHNVKCWLVNTGWTGGPYGVGHRMSIKYTRALLNAALDGKLDKVELVTDHIFGLSIPKECPGVPADVLMPKNTWKDDQKAKDLAKRFKENFKEFEAFVADDVKQAGPIL